MFQVLKQEVQDHKPDVDRLNKTGGALIKICGEQEGGQVQKIMDDQNAKMEDVKNYLKDRSLSIDEALQQSAEVRVTMLAQQLFTNAVYVEVMWLLLYCSY